MGGSVLIWDTLFFFYLFVRRWVNQRKAFGKPLSSQAVIRNKLASMIARVESVQSWLETITYQMNHMVKYNFSE